MAWMQILFSLLKVIQAQEIHGHRGARAIYPENTLPSIEYAFLFGADIVEVDTHYTKDGVVVIHHDPSVNKSVCLDGQGQRIRKEVILFQSSLEHLKTYDCGSLTLSNFPDQMAVPGARIPTLQEVVDIFQVYSFLNQNLKLNIEIKYEKNNKYPDLALYVNEVLRIVDDNKLAETSVLQSFSKDVVSYIKKKRPELETYFLTANPLTNYMDVLKDTNADGISLHHSLVTKNVVQKIRLQNKKILSWTANEKKDWKKLIELEIDGIITDDPNALYIYKKEVSMRSPQ